MKRPYLIALIVLAAIVCGFILGNLWCKSALKPEPHFLSESEVMMDPIHTKHQLIVVFKKTVSEEQAINIVTAWNIDFSEGMDSSRGKIYFYETGEKFILTFENEEQLKAFKMKRYQFLPEVHEIYAPDWRKQKD